MNIIKSGENIRLRSDGRYEARYIKERTHNGAIRYGYCYGATEDEVREKKYLILEKKNICRKMNLLILGAGSHGSDVKDIAQRLHIFGEIKFLDDEKEGPQILGKWECAKKYLNDYPVAIVAVGNNELRRHWMMLLREYGFLVPVLVHPTAFLSENVELGLGTVVCARVSISNDVKIGKGCIIEVGKTIDRNSVIPDWTDYT